MLYEQSAVRANSVSFPGHPVGTDLNRNGVVVRLVERDST